MQNQQQQLEKSQDCYVLLNIKVGSYTNDSTDIGSIVESSSCFTEQKFDNIFIYFIRKDNMEQVNSFTRTVDNNLYDFGVFFLIRIKQKLLDHLKNRGYELKDFL